MKDNDRMQGKEIRKKGKKLWLCYSKTGKVLLQQIVNPLESFRFCL